MRAGKQQIESRVWLRQRTSLISAQLGDLMSVLLQGRGTSVTALRNLAAQILAEATQIPDRILLVPESGTDATAFLPEDKPDSEQRVCVGAIQAARFLAAFLQDNVDWESRAELLVAAALLSDVGLLSLESGFRIDSQRLAIENPHAYAQHPLISAALVGQVRGAPVELALLIGEHHECLDGTGFPRGAGGRLLGRPARLLGLVIRFVRLLDVYSQSTKETKPEGDSRQETLVNAAWQLDQEGRLGELDRVLVAEFLRRVDPELPGLLAAQFQDRRVRPLAEGDDRRIRIDTLHVPPPASEHTALGRRKGSGLQKSTSRGATAAAQGYRPPRRMQF